MTKVLLPKPPSINHIYGFTSKGGFARSYITKDGRDWFEAARVQLKKQWKKKTPITSECEIWIDLYTAYRRDIDNFLKPVLDLLQKNGVVENDSQFYSLHVTKTKCKKEEERLEFEIMGYS